MRTSFPALAVAALLASGGAVGQGASGVGASSNAGTISNSVDSRAGSTGAAKITPGTGRTARDSSGIGVEALATTPPADAASPATVPTEREWKVPLGAEHDPNFQRWQRLK